MRFVRRTFQLNTFQLVSVPRLIIGMILLVSLQIVPSACRGSDASSQKPNVLFISIDDLNDWVGCYGGHPQVKTPAIDKLARQGTVFLNAQCQAPICNPSRASLITGLRPSTTGIYFLGPDFRRVEKTRTAESLFQYFQKHGYYTITRGKIFHGKMSDIDRASFDEISPARSGASRPKKKLSYDKPNSSKLWDWGAWPEKDEQVRDHLTATWAATRLEELAQKEKPFFMAVGFSLPHVPLYVPQKWFDLYPQAELKLPQNPTGDLDDISDYAIKLTLSGVAPRHRWFLEHGEFAHAVQAYLACISFVDHCVGITLDALERSGEAENTIIVLWSDHGFHLGEKQRWAKRSLWEESARSPLIIAGPGCLKNVQCNRPVELIDMYPTLIELCNLPSKKKLEGVSLQPLLNNPKAEWSRPAITTFGPNNHSIRSQRWRYIRYDDGSEELYDHKTDPDEITNLAHLPQFATVISEHAKWLPKINVPPAAGSSGSGTPIYREIERKTKLQKK